jgi:2-(1,2-epoxy-1,2-dihydrophenyl)acetyl-CoA isomerase
MQYDTLRFSTHDNLAVIMLNLPKSQNMLTAQMRAELTHAVHVAGKTARALVITGAGRAFCAGQDLGDNVKVAAADLERVLRDEYEPMLHAIFNCPIPTIAAVNGAAIGAGASLALACDVVIAAQSAVFAQTATRLGLMPDAGATFMLPRKIGQARAMGAALFGDVISAEQAAQWGMIYESVADASFETHWAARAAQLAAGPTVAYRNVKTALKTAQTNTLKEQLTLEAKLQGQCGATRDFREGVSAFTGQRTADFEGR